MQSLKQFFFFLISYHMSLFSQIDLLYESKISLDERKNVPLVISDGTLVLILLFHVTSSLFTYFYAVIFCSLEVNKPFALGLDNFEKQSELKNQFNDIFL